MSDSPRQQPSTGSKTTTVTTRGKLDNPPENGAYTVHSKTKATASKVSNTDSTEITPDAYKNARKDQTNPMKPLGSEHNSVLPKIVKKPGEYVPMAYIFRVPCSSLSFQIKDGYVRCPPFYIQLDHAIAVVWSLFSKDPIQKPLGINQLQWALGFLNNIRDTKGKHPDDVQLCIDAINEELIEQYAELVDDIQFIQKGKKCRKKNFRIQSATKRDDFAPKATSSQNSIHAPSETNSNTSQASQQLDKAKSEIFVQRNVPFSLNYADMINRCPPPSDNDNDIDVGPNRPTNSTQTPKRKCSANCTGSGNADPNYNKKAVMNFLQQMRTDQVQKISAELERLHSIEEYMTTGKGPGFERYMDPNDREMATIFAQKINKKNNAS